MNQADALKRLEALEAQARVSELERSLTDPASRETIERHAARAGVTPEQFIREAAAILQHIAEIGEDAYEAECLAVDREQAERFGITLERYCEIDWDREYAEWVAEGSIPGTWRGRDWNS